MADEQADKYIDRLLAERQKALASRKPAVTPEAKAVLAELDVAEDEPFVVELIRRYGKIPTDVLNEMSSRKARWGF